jgi:hypothetical protein
LHCDDTIIPVLAPKTGQAKKGRMWVVVSDGCPYQGSDPPAVVYFYSPDRKGEHPRAFMKGFSGVLQADGFTGFNAMYQPDPLTQEIQVKAERGTTVAFSGCRVGGDVAVPTPHRPGRADFPHPVLRAQGSLMDGRIDGRSWPAARDVERACL